MPPVPDEVALSRTVERDSERENQINLLRLHTRMVLAATQVATAPDTNAASTSAYGWLCRWIGAAGPFAGSQAMRNPPEMTERVSAHTSPIRCIVSAQYERLASKRWRGRLRLAFRCLAVDFATLVDNGLLLLLPARGRGGSRVLGPPGPGSGSGLSSRPCIWPWNFASTELTAPACPPTSPGGGGGGG